MDVNAALEYARQAIADGDHRGLVEAFQAIDGWLKRGGFSPAAAHISPLGYNCDGQAREVTR